MALCLPASFAYALEARDIIEDCTFISPGRKTANVHDAGGESAGYFYIRFMDKQLSRIGEYPDSTKLRPTTELIGIGRSDLIDPQKTKQNIKKPALSALMQGRAPVSYIVAVA